MRKITLILTVLLGFITSYAGAQSKQTSDESAIKAISEVSNMTSANLLDWQSGLVYKVQFLTSKEPLSSTDARLKNLGNVYSYEHNGLTKYIWGRTRLRHEASRLKRELRRNGFDDAFVVYFYNGKRISQKEAEAIQKRK
ncbi:hypothetical protein [Salinimicrobium gaetbulicola]|uniref:Sporulation related protein n=1 Tax=Salinimicrobium gaetbulicola TaxID=999702 RepID=A0ABW3IDV9_9FLAO